MNLSCNTTHVFALLVTAAFTACKADDQTKPSPAKANSFKAATDIYTYWGSSWATLGLLQAVPVK